MPHEFHTLLEGTWASTIHQPQLWAQHNSQSAAHGHHTSSPPTLPRACCGPGPTTHTTGPALRAGYRPRRPPADLFTSVAHPPAACPAQLSGHPSNVTKELAEYTPNSMSPQRTQACPRMWTPQMSTLSSSGPAAGQAPTRNSERPPASGSHSWSPHLQPRQAFLLASSGPHCSQPAISPGHSHSCSPPINPGVSQLTHTPSHCHDCSLPHLSSPYVPQNSVDT